MHRPRIVLADDEPILLELIQGMLSERFDVVSTVEDGTALLQAAERDHPDVIVSNITMPGVNGFEAARRIRKRSPNLPIIFISAHTQHIYVEEAIKIGVAGYIFKGRVQSELLPAIDCALRGETFFSKPKGGNFISR
jgi:DNA-binding NarL/FixJ family response regulator